MLPMLFREAYGAPEYAAKAHILSKDEGSAASGGRASAGHHRDSWVVGGGRGVLKGTFTDSLGILIHGNVQCIIDCRAEVHLLGIDSVWGCFRL